MIIGNGLLATEFYKSKELYDHVLIFASGVSNSSEKCLDSFEREKTLLKKAISENPEKLFVCFSSCALVDDAAISPYYMHKRSIEILVKKISQNYLLIRLPQVIGVSKNQTTLINYLFDCIKNGKEFQLRDQAYRYVIDIVDVRKIVNYLIQNKFYHNKTIDLANTYKYSIYEIVKIFEDLLEKKAKYHVINQIDKYELNLDILKNICENELCNIHFGKDYLLKKINEDYGNYS